MCLCSNVGANGSKTALVESYKNGGDAKYNYTYDANGNITQIWRGNGTFASATEKYSYSYDAANQLVRENLYYGSGNSNNATYTYTYDSWGNILTKKQHAYSTGSAGPGIVVANYGYTNSIWKDQLTSYNNQSITYDAMGNPISYLGATLSWNGKQLTGYSKGGTNVTYAYNEDGLRTQKTYNGTTTNYYYNGSVLIGMQSGNTVQRFSYDAQGKVVAVDYSTNGGNTYTTYYYLRNAQGDIVKLIDNNKNTVVEYTYDSWGKLISTTGSLAASLGANQPFRYRGYVYDTETQWYYLQSRYYNPEVCRFISSDVYLSTGQGVIGHNSYAYCLNNPVNFADNCGCYAEALVLGSSVIAALSSALAGLMAGISTSMASIASAIASCWLVPVCVVAVSIAIAGIVYTVRQVQHLCDEAASVRAKVKAQIAKGGVKVGSGYSVYVIVDKNSNKVVYVGMTKNFYARMRAHNARFPDAKYTKLAVATGLSRTQARVLEQTLITAFSLEALFNIINSISPSKWKYFMDEFNRMQSLMQSWVDTE